jgi:iron complex transport system permease protein
MLIALCMGQIWVSPLTGLQAIFHYDPIQLTHRILWEIRLPRVVDACVCGTGLATVGLWMQAWFRNPLADPYSLGVSGAASMGAVLAIICGAQAWQPLWALGGAMLMVGLIHYLTAYHRYRHTPLIRHEQLLLIGLLSAMVCGAVVQLSLLLLPQPALRSALFWLMGDLSDLPYREALYTITFIWLVWLWRHRRDLDQLRFGTDLAQHYGTHVQQLGWQGMGLSSWVIAMIVVNIGSMGFLGLVIPHLIRRLFKQGGHLHQRLIQPVMIAGAMLLLLSDTIARSLVTAIDLPTGAIMTLLGAPLLLWVLLR